MTVTQTANAIRTACHAYAEPKGGYAKVMGNIRKLWEELYVVEEKPRILIVWNGEEARGGFEEANTLHRVDRTFLVVVVRGKGFTNNLSEDPNGADPFYQQVEEIRDICRCLLITEEFPVDYKSISSLPNVMQSKEANVFMDAYMIEFSVAADLGEVILETPGTEETDGSELPP